MRVQQVIFSYFVLLQIFAASCSNESVGESFTTNTKAEEGRIALRNQDYELAITLFIEAIAIDSNDYESYLKLGTAYAGRAGVDLVNLIKKQLGEQTESGGGVLDTMKQFVPANPSDNQMSDIERAIASIKTIPEDRRIKGGSYDYSNEAASTLNLFLSSSSAMLVNKYSATDEETGELDREKLEEMSDQEVDALFNNLESVKASGDESLSPAVEETLAEIYATEGATQKEKLLNYLSKS